MIVLGIETSGRAGSVSIVEGQTTLAETELSATGRRHARTLVPEIGQLLRDVGLGLPQLDGVAVSIGPGSFTGLRVGVVCAKTLAYATGKHLIAVDTFLAIAEASDATVNSVWVIDDALRGDVFAGYYQRSENSQWQSLLQPQLISLDDFRSRVVDGDLVSGPGVARLIDEVSGLPIVAADVCQPQASQIALIGERRLCLGDVDNFWTAEPHYIRRSAAEEKADAQD